MATQPYQAPSSEVQLYYSSDPQLGRIHTDFLDIMGWIKAFISVLPVLMRLKFSVKFYNYYYHYYYYYDNNTT